MKTESNITPDDSLVSNFFGRGRVTAPEVVAPADNEVQGVLRSILDWWGPTGERWCGHYMDGERGCVVRAIEVLCRPANVTKHPAYRYLTTAAKEMGLMNPVWASDSSFRDARKMVLRAIELAA